MQIPGGAQLCLSTGLCGARLSACEQYQAVSLCIRLCMSLHGQGHPRSPKESQGLKALDQGVRVQK